MAKKNTVETPTNVLARVLVECSLGLVDDVIELDADTLKQAVAMSLVDPHPDAVAYAQSLGV
jgi:hypothetical protein